MLFKAFLSNIEFTLTVILGIILYFLPLNTISLEVSLLNMLVAWSILILYLFVYHSVMLNITLPTILYYEQQKDTINVILIYKLLFWIFLTNLILNGTLYIMSRHYLMYNISLVIGCALNLYSILMLKFASTDLANIIRWQEYNLYEQVNQTKLQQ